MLVALASLKGSPGVTSLGVALTARWPGEIQRAFVECDPAGGDLAARYSLPLSPGLIALAAATRQDASLDALQRHTQMLPDGTPVVVGPLRSDQARTALKTLVGDQPEATDETTRSSVFSTAAQARDIVVLADCGRLDPDSPTRPIIEVADALLLLLRPRADELSRLAALLDSVAELADRIGLVLVGAGYSATEVSAELEVPIFATVPDLASRSRAGRFGQTRAQARLHRVAVTIAEQLTPRAEDIRPDQAEGQPDSVKSSSFEPDDQADDGAEQVPELTTNGRRP